MSPGAVAADGSDRSSIGLYVHFPFCRARCHYCAFYFVVGRETVHARYVAAATREVAVAAADPRFSGRPVDSIYFGGGTPSLLPAAAVHEIVDAVAAAFPLAGAAEISLEANPDGLDEPRLRDLRAAGVNRITLGFQSMRGPGLRALTRTHSPHDNRRALDAARRAGHDNVGVDMIFGRPGQTTSDWEEEIAEVARLAPEHVSAYELTLEEGTRFLERNRAGRFVLPGQDDRADMFELTEDVLARAGIVRYEISNFAEPGRECRHNVAGWRSGDLCGVGASAASHVANARWTNVADLDDYVKRVEADRSPAGPEEVLDAETWAGEDLYLGLRLCGGIDADARLRDLGSAGERLRSVLAGAERDGRLERREASVRFTRRGRLLADGLFEELLAPSSPTPGSGP